jgi:hypothetical protein
MSGLDLRADGDDATGWRVVWAGGAKHVLVEDGEYRVMGVGADLGAWALELIERGQVDAARRWLGRKRDDSSSAAPAGDALAGALIARVWPRGAPEDAPTLLVAAASLLARGAAPGAAIPILREAHARAASGDARDAIEQALVAALRGSGQLDDAQALTTGLLARHPGSLTAFYAHASVLRESGREDAVEATARARLARAPDDLDATEMLALRMGRRGDHASANALYERLSAKGDVAPSVQNNRAWRALFLGGATEEAVALAKLAVEGTAPGRRGEQLHTLATLYAELGRGAEAMQALHQEWQESGAPGPADADWYVIGRVAEDYGLPEEALAAYRRVSRPQQPDAESTWVLAQRRLGALAPAAAK